MLPSCELIYGRTEIAAAFPAAFDAGRVIDALTTTRAESDGNIGYVVQTVHGKQADGTVMLALRCSEDGVCSYGARG
jgi:hypothetical protein